MNKIKSINNIQDLGLFAANRQSIGRQPILGVHFLKHFWIFFIFRKNIFRNFNFNLSKNIYF
jgi:hypothetical protein